MFKLALGSVAAAVAMFITGFLFFATPLGMIAYSSASDAQNANVQAALAANLPQTGTYMVPDPSSQAGTIMFGKGPIATVHYNSHGFSVTDMSSVIWGFAQELVVCLILAGALSHLDRRIPDFASRARIVILFSIAAAGMIRLGDPVWNHQDWAYGIYTFVAEAAMLIVAGLVLARWFLPNAAEMASPVQKVEEAARGVEISPSNGAGL
jgi:hypothetical protein